MTTSELKATRRPARWRYLIDIVVVVAVTFLLDALPAAFVRVPIDLKRGLVFDAVGKMLLVGVGCGLVLLRGETLADIGLKRPESWTRTLIVGEMLLVGVGGGLVLLRGETLADIGLKRPESWTRTLIVGVGLAAIVFVAIYLSEKAGFRRNLTRFKDVEGNLPLAVLGFFYAFIGAGFYEEFTFRGFLMQGVAMFFGASRGAWIVACIVQGALFGMVHAYQNPFGIAITGTLGVLMGLLVLAFGRNLWPVIIAHGLFDASRFVLFYFQGAPTG